MTPDGAVSAGHTFVSGEDVNPGRTAVLAGRRRQFYGLGSGGPATTGTVLQLTLDGPFNVVYWFPGNQNGTTPSTLIQASDGNVLYSNGGYVVLGRVVEIVSGQAYADSVSEHIYRPAGMTSSGVLKKGERDPAVSATLRRTRKGDPSWVRRQARWG